MTTSPDKAGKPAPISPGAGREAARALGVEAIETLKSIMRTGSSETAKIAACNALLDRGFGKPRAGEAVEAPPDTVVTVRFV